MAVAVSIRVCKTFQQHLQQKNFAKLRFNEKQNAYFHPDISSFAIGELPALLHWVIYTLACKSKLITSS
jgi:hypothetical protein